MPAVGPPARHRPADGRGGPRHGPGVGRRRDRRRPGVVAAGRSSSPEWRPSSSPCGAGALREPTAPSRPRLAARPDRRGRRARRWRASCCCARFAEGAVLLGTMTLLPPAVEERRRDARGGRTGDRRLRRLGVPRLSGSSAGSRSAGTAARLIRLGAVLGGPRLPAARRLPGRRRRRSVAARPPRPGLDGDALHPADLGDGGAARRPGPRSSRSSPAPCSWAARWRRSWLAGLARQRPVRVLFAAGAVLAVPLGLGARLGPAPLAAPRTRPRRGPRLVLVQTPTLRDVAEDAGVHAATASRALNPATRGLVNAETARRVIRVAETLGYRPNPIARGPEDREVRHRRTGHPRPDQPAVPTDRARHRGRARAGRLQRADREHRQRPRARERPDRAAARASGRGPHRGHRPVDHPLLDQLRREGVRMVMVNRRPDGVDVPSITARRRRRGELAVQPPRRPRTPGSPTSPGRPTPPPGRACPLLPRQPCATSAWTRTPPVTTV